MGGLGAGPAELVEVTSRLATACGSTAMVYLMHISAAMPIAAAPPPGLPDVVARLARGEALGTLAFSEPGSRSHFWAPMSRSALGAGAVRLDAGKSWVTSAGHADVYVVSTLRPDGASESDTIDVYAVPADTAGVTVAGPWHGMGLRGNASAPMRFDTTVPESYRLGARGAGFDLMLQIVMP